MEIWSVLLFVCDSLPALQTAGSCALFVPLWMRAKLLQSCLILCDPMDYSPWGSLSMGFSRQEYWSGLSCPPPGDLPDPGIKHAPHIYLHWQVCSLPLTPPVKSVLLLVFLIYIQIIYIFRKLALCKMCFKYFLAYPIKMKKLLYRIFFPYC